MTDHDPHDAIAPTPDNRTHAARIHDEHIPNIHDRSRCGSCRKSWPCPDAVWAGRVVQRAEFEDRLAGITAALATRSPR